MSAHRSSHGGTLIAMLSLVTAGCGTHPAAPPEASEMVNLVEVATAAGQPGLSRHTPLVLGADGSWAYSAPRVSGSAAVLVDDRHPLGLLIGGVGEGPGSARMPLPVRVDSAGLSMYDMATARYTTWNREGGVVSSTWLPPSLPLLRGVPGGQLMAVRRMGREWTPLLIDPVSGKVRELDQVHERDYPDLFPPSDSARPGWLGPEVVFGVWSGGLVVGNGKNFRFALLDEDRDVVGRVSLELPKRQLTEVELDRELDRLEGAGLLPRNVASREEARRRLSEEVRPWVDRLSFPRVDQRDRLWIVRASGLDTAVVELFSGSTHLGSVPLACPDFGGEWAIAGEWFAIVCGPSDPASDEDAVVRRFRIQTVRPGGERR